MASWTISRFYNDTNKNAPIFAFHGTIYWMRALSLLVNDDRLSDQNISNHYQKIIRRNPNQNADNLVFENVIMAFHNLSSLNAMNLKIESKYDIVRSAIIAWYYCIYFTSSAMVAASSGDKQETHTATAKAWHSECFSNNRNLIIEPFSLHLDDLTSEKLKEQISNYRNGNQFKLPSCPKNKEEAWGAIVSYLEGTAEHEQEKIKKKIVSSQEFKKLGVDNFRTKAARNLRDEKFKKAQVNFLNQAFRYRGKANYRDSIYLSFHNNRDKDIAKFISDLFIVAKKFLRMSVYYFERRVEKNTWNYFVGDLEEKLQLSETVDVLKI